MRLVRNFARTLSIWGLSAGLVFGTVSPASVESSVEISDVGLVIGVPEGGLRPVGAPGVLLAGEFTEWFGVSYVGPAGPVEAVGTGREPDWAGRPSVQPVSFHSSDGEATSVVLAGELEVRTRMVWDEALHRLDAQVTVTNRGRSTAEDVAYTREWRSPEECGWTFSDHEYELVPAPDDVCRHAWTLGDIEPEVSLDLRFSYDGSETHPPDPPLPADVPLRLWTHEDFPQGLAIGETHGVSWGDFDSDGYVDLFACHSGNLWRNVGGVTWEFAADLSALLPPTERRYGASFADYDRDGHLDIGTEPRFPFWGDDKMHLLRNLGPGAGFVDVAGDPAIVDVQPYNNGETLCWGDVDGDRNLDAFLPVYPSAVAGPGNFFLYNLGPTGPGGAYRFAEMSAEAGLDNPPGKARPEGAQFVDVDFDGDIDLYSNGTLYRNASEVGVPAFEVMSEEASGIGLGHSRDEGAIFFDYDMDGDQDLVIAYTFDGVRIWENRGDGSFFAAEPGIVDERYSGLNLGLSAGDWDNDGDIDFTTRQVFRRNMLVEGGNRHFAVATHAVPAEHVSSATPAWGDWDRDGDLDCAMGNQGLEAHFYENTLYKATTPPSVKRHLRVRVVGDSSTVDRGLEVEFGATAEVRLSGTQDRLRRRQFVASSHGYLNQNEYGLHFGLPQDPTPGSYNSDVRFDLSVDFPGVPSEGIWRVDEHINPALRAIDLANLTEREVIVYRCGRVVVNGVSHEPIPLASLTMNTTAGGLASPAATTPLPDPAAAPGPNWFTGLAFDTLGTSSRVRVLEIVLDGQLDAPAPCFENPFNVALWDVTDPSAPFIIEGGALKMSTSSRNSRSHLRTDLMLEPGREYRLIARVTALRKTTIDGPVSDGLVTVLGGIDYENVAACGGSMPATMPVDATVTSLALRYRPVPSNDAVDPVGESLRLGKPAGNTVLVWDDLGAVAYRVFRCDARLGPCTPEPVATGPDRYYYDADVTQAPGELLWYRVTAVNRCAAELP
jgi:hypothetical protein